ncbi:amino acid adenylation domain-containing protein [Myxococcus sp. Y35]|uniref:amino acid adenylation domain-containing protein n=1 Tax=Pseudomyxococcus flavus TaxID=3115648 RepID=UPI003CEEA9C0
MHLPTRADPASDFVCPEDATFVEVCRARAAAQPDDWIYTFLDSSGERALSYAALDANARAVAALLQRHLAPGERALLLYPPGFDYTLGFLACLYAGVVAVPAYPPDPMRLGRTLPRLQALVADCGARVALTTSGIAGMVESLTEGAPDLRALRWLATDAVPVSEAGAWRAPDLRGDSVAFLQYTSGSTGTPRGVVLRHRHLLHNSWMITRAFDTRPHPVGAYWLPPYHDMGLIGGLLQALFRDVPTVLLPPMAFLQRPLTWLEAISRFGASVCGAPNFAFDLCVRKTTPEQRAALDLSRLEVMFSGAEPVRADTLERFAEAFAPAGFRREAFFPCYGLAEGTLIVSGGERSAVPVVRRFARDGLLRGEARAPEEDTPATVLVGCGQVLGGQDARVVDPDTGRPCAPGRIGELWVRGPSVADGYWQRPEETERTFHGRLSDSGEGPYLRTGDLAVLDGGEVFITGRLKDVLVLRGLNYYPQDLEHAADRCHPGVRPGCAAAFAVDVDDEERLVLVQEVAAKVATPEAGAEVVASIRAALGEVHGLAAHAVVLIAAGTLPKTSSGKVQRRATREAFLAGALDVVHAWKEDLTAASLDTVPETGDVLTVLRSRLASLLGVHGAALREDVPLLHHGLDSLRALEVLHAVDAAWGVAPPIASLLQGQSLRDLAQWVERARTEGADAPPGALASVASAAPVTFVSEGEQALWFLQRIAPGSKAYLVSQAVRFVAPVDADALTRAFSALVARHPALSSAFPEVQGAPARMPCATPPELARVDASTWTEDALRERLEAEAQAAFDLERGPLVRARLYTGAPQGDVLLLAMHHLVTDFWSLEVIAAELGALYTAEVRGTPADLPPPAPPVSPVLLTLAQRTTGPRGEALLAWWRERLGGELPVLDLPTSFPRPRLQSFRGAQVSFRMPRETSTQLKALAQAHGATPFMVLLAGYLAFLRRYSGQEDLIVGTPTAGRPRADLSRQVGYFVNPVALRARVPRTLSFSGLVAQVRTTVLEALAHQELPFARLVEQLQPRRDPSRAPVFQTMFALQSTCPGSELLGAFAVGASGARARLGELTVESVPLNHPGAAFDVALMMAELEGTFVGRLEYCAGLFDAATAARMARHLGALLESAVARPDAPLGDLPLLESDERRAVLALGRRTQDTRGAPVPGILPRIEAWAEKTPDAPALVAGASSWSYRELAAWVNRLAARLRRHGVGPEVRVGTLLERSSPEQVVAFLAILKAGGTAVPQEPSYPPARVAWTLADSGARLLLAQERYAQRLVLPEGVTLLPWEAHGDGDDAPVSAALGAGEPPPDCAAYITYTSGSTGTPKGVVVPYRGTAHLCESMVTDLPVGPGSRVLQFASPAFDMSAWDYFLALASGGALHLSPGGPPAGEALYRMLREQRITSATLPPPVAALLPEGPLPDLSMFMVAAEACPASLVARFAEGRAFYNGYGPTEVTVGATWGLVTPDEVGPPHIGRSMPHVDTYVLDEALQPVPIGVAGELYVGGPSVARGYLDRPDLTAERFIPDPFGGEPGARLYRTGDLARLRADGRLDFQGRADTQLKIRGFRIEPGEVETALRVLAGMCQAHVTAWRPSGDGEPRLVAYVVPPPGDALVPGALRARLREQLPEHMIPVDIVPVEALPLLATGKVDVRALPRPSLTVSTEGKPRTSLEEVAARAWAEALGLPEVDVHAHFFDDLGGSSLSAVRACSRLREALGQDVPITHFFEHPTVHELARRLQAEARPEPASDVKHQSRAEARRHALQRRGRTPRGND